MYLTKKECVKLRNEKIKKAFYILKITDKILIDIWLGFKMVSKKTKVLSLSWVGSSQEDTTDVVLSDFDISLVSPISRPGVLDEEVVNSVFSTITNSEDTVVKLSTATPGEDTWGIGLESRLIGFNGNWNGLMHEGSFQLSGGVGWDIGVAGNFTNTLGLDVFTWTIISSVRIRRF